MNLPKSCDGCSQYPEDGQFCPMYLQPSANSFVEENSVTGERRILEGCYYQLVPQMLVHVIDASNRPASAMNSMRNELVDVFQVMSKTLEIRVGDEKLRSLKNNTTPLLNNDSRPPQTSQPTKSGAV